MNKRYTVFLFLIFVVISAFSQRNNVNQALREINSANPNINYAEGLAKRATEDTLTNKLPKTWYSAGYIEFKIYDIEYAKENPDYRTMYKALFNGYNYFVKALEIDGLPDKKGNVKFEYTKQIKQTLRNKQNAFKEGGAYYWDDKTFDMAYRMFDIYTEIPTNENIRIGFFVPDTNYYEAVMYKALSASRMKNQRQAIAILETLKGSNYHENMVYQYITHEYKTLKDIPNYQRTLMEGANKFPEEQYFVESIIEYYLSKDLLEEASFFMDRSIGLKPDNPTFYNFKGRILEKLNQQKNSIYFYDRATSIDNKYTDAWGNAGRVYYNLALDAQNNASNMSDEAYDNVLAREVRPYYQKSLPYYEEAYNLDPDNREFFLALRNIYYYLGMVDKYDGIEADYTKRQEEGDNEAVEEEETDDDEDMEN